MAEDSFLRVRIANKRPVELLDFTSSMTALGRSFEDYVIAQGFDNIEQNTKLYVKAFRKGSIIAELQALLDQTSFVIDHKEMFAAFLSNFVDIANFFLSSHKAEDKEAPPRIAAERVAQVVEPIAKDNGSVIIFQVQGDLHLHQHRINSVQANAIQNGVRRHYGPSLPTNIHFRGEILTLFQLRDDLRGRVGDRGIIDKFSPRPVRLLFMSEEAKRQVLEQPENPLHLAFIVDGEVGLIDGKPAIYKIYYVHESLGRSDTA